MCQKSLCRWKNVPHFSRMTVPRGSNRPAPSQRIQAAVKAILWQRLTLNAFILQLIRAIWCEWRAYAGVGLGACRMASATMPKASNSVMAPSRCTDSGKILMSSGIVESLHQVGGNRDRLQGVSQLQGVSATIAASHGAVTSAFSTLCDSATFFPIRMNVGSALVQQPHFVSARPE